MATRTIERKRERERLELLYHVGRELSSRLDLSDLLRRILVLTTESIGAPSGSIMALDSQGGLLAAALIYNGQVYDNAVQQLSSTMAHGLAGWVIRSAQPALIHDTTRDERWLRRDDAADALPKSAIGVPLQSRERVVGALTLVHSRALAFTDEDLSLATAIADQAAVAVENARLFNDLRQQTALYETLLNAQSDLGEGLLIADATSQRLVYVNDAFCQISGYAADQLTALPSLFDLAVPEERAELLDGLQRRLGGEQRSDRFETTIYHKDGRRIILEVAVKLLRSDDSQRIIGIVRDITQRKQAEQALAEEKQRLELLYDLSQSTASRLDPRAVGQAALERICAAMGVATRGTLLVRDADGQRLRLLVATWVERAALEAFDRQISLGIGQGLAGWAAERRRVTIVEDVTRDPRWKGTPEFDGWVRASLSLPLVAGDELVGVLNLHSEQPAAFQDAHVPLLLAAAAPVAAALHNARLFEETQAAERRYAGLFEDSIDPIILTDPAGTIIDSNRKACAFLGYAREQMLGLSIEAVHPLATALDEPGLAELRSGAETSFETTAVAKGGQLIPVEVHVKHIVRGGQELIQWIEHDLSERAALEEMRNDLTSMIFHDLRSPLSNIVSSLDVLKASLPPDDDAMQAVLTIAYRSSQRLSRLVESLLDLRRLESGRSILKREPTVLNALVAEVAEQVHAVAEAKDISLHFDLPPGLPAVNLDADMVRRVLINLMENGVKYTQGVGMISVTVRVDANEARISIRDTGPGIPEDQQQRVFDKFTRLQHPGGPKGLGLGLAFCKLAVEAHGGRIWVESAPGEGSTFILTLPIT